MSATATKTITVEEAKVRNILKQIEQWPAIEQLWLAELIRERHIPPVKAPLDRRVPAKPIPDDKRERAWVEEHKHEYAGQWVALDGDRLIAASPIQQNVWDAVQADSAELPLVLRVSSPDDLPPIGI